MLKFAEVLNQSISTPRRNLSMDRLPILTFLVAIIATLSILLASCGGRNATLDRHLADAEEIMEARPDSAYSILADSIDSIALRSATQRQKALYALLITQANHKLYKIERNDSLISIAVDFFDGKNDKEYLMKSLFYQGTIQNEAGDYPKAIISAIRANTLAEELSDLYWEARAKSLLSQIYSITYSSEEAIQYAGKAAEIYKRIGRDDFYAYCKVDEAQFLSQSGRYDAALALIDSVEDLLPSPYYKAYCADVKAPILSLNGRDEEAERLYDTVIKYMGADASATRIYAMTAIVKMDLGKFDEGEHYIRQAISTAQTLSDSISLNVSLTTLYELTDRYKDAFETEKELLLKLNEKMNSQRLQSTLSSQRDYYVVESQKNLEIATKRKYILAIVSVAALIIAIFGFMLYRMSVQRKKMEINRTLAEMLLLSRRLKQNDELNQQLKDEVDSQRLNLSFLSNTVSAQSRDLLSLSSDVAVAQTENEKLQKAMRKLLTSHFAHLDMLINEYAEKENDDSQQAMFVLYKNLKREVDKFTHPKSISQIETIVNQCMDNILIKMSAQIPALSTKDISFLALLFAGFGARAIGRFMKMKPNSTYNKKRNLVRLIKESDADDKDWFLEELAKV